MRNKQIICLMLAFIMIISVVDQAWATTISDIKKEQEESQNKLDEVDNQMSGIENSQNAVENEMKTLDQELIEIFTSISILEDYLITKEKEIAEATIKYEEAQVKEKEQYETMRLRIKFMYEEGNASYFELLLQAESIIDMINKADYIEQLYEYDRNLLEVYEKAKDDVAIAKVELELEQEELKTLQHQQEEEQAALDIELAKKQNEADNYEQQLAKVKQDAAIYKAQIQQQNAKIKEIEAAEAKRLAALQPKKPSTSNTGKVDPVIITSAKGSALGKEIAQYAVQFVGNPYVIGGTSLTNGADCSGFTSTIYRNYGYSIPRTSTSQRNAGRSVEFSDLEPGDLVCYAGHVAMYIGSGKIVHASTSRTGIIIGNVSYRPIITMRRIV